eukprot:COSAG01_NODE_58_length_30193_cov_12.302020_25_plen_93_part_00
MHLLTVGRIGKLDNAEGRRRAGGVRDPGPRRTPRRHLLLEQARVAAAFGGGWPRGEHGACVGEEVVLACMRGRAVVVNHGRQAGGRAGGPAG